MTGKKCYCPGFSPESYESDLQAGLLACPVSGGLPVPIYPDSGKGVVRDFLWTYSYGDSSRLSRDSLLIHHPAISENVGTGTCKPVKQRNEIILLRGNRDDSYLLTDRCLKLNTMTGIDINGFSDYGPES